MSKCYECKYEHSDCRGNKQNDCPNFKKRNAVNYAARIRELERDLQFIYQVHRRGGEWEDAYDYIEGTYRHEANARAKVEELMAEQIKVVKAYKEGQDVSYDKVTEEFYIVNVLVDDWRDAE